MRHPTRSFPSHLGPVFKVLDDKMRSCHGGITTTWKLGQWKHTPDGSISICSHGLHVTNHPMLWGLIGMRVFEVEHKGTYDYDHEDKVACRSVKLIRERTDMIWPEWIEVQAMLKDAESWPIFDVTDTDPSLGQAIYADHRAEILHSGLTDANRMPREYNTSFESEGGGSSRERWQRIRIANGLTDKLSGIARSIIGQAVARHAERNQSFYYRSDSVDPGYDFRRDVTMFSKYTLMNGADAENNTVSQELTNDINQRIAAWKAGYGVYGRSDDGNLLLYLAP